jgi:hypothetical protein
MEKTLPSNEWQEAPIAENSYRMAALPRFLALYWGGIPRKERAKEEVTLGWNAEKNLFFVGGTWRKTAHAKTWLTNCPLSRYSTSFLKWVHCPLSGGGCAQTSRFPTLLHSKGKMPVSYSMTAPVQPGRCRYRGDGHLNRCCASPADSKNGFAPMSNERLLAQRQILLQRRLAVSSTEFDMETVESRSVQK